MGIDLQYIVAMFANLPAEMKAKHVISARLYAVPDG